MPRAEQPPTLPAGLVRYREIGPAHAPAFRQQGLRPSAFFPHVIYYLPKYGPDGLKMSERLCGTTAPNASWEVVVYGTGPNAAEFPRSLYFDEDVVWHGQHFGRPCQVATANLVVGADGLYGNNYLSDLVQRIGRRREHKTRVENRFRGWPSMVLNAILNFAVETGLPRVFSPTADCVLAQAPPGRIANRGLFDRIYDATVLDRYRADRRGPWWVIDVRENAARIVAPIPREERLTPSKTISICHDVEAGWGHVGIDAARAAVANQLARPALRDMLEAERTAGIATTYNVLGRMLPDVRNQIARDRHALGFHSYDHRIRPLWDLTRHGHRLLGALDRMRGVDDGPHRDQLARCRIVDKQIRGFRPPRSRPSGEWSDHNLALWNFEWLATSARRMGSPAPVLDNRLVKIPIHVDDFSLYRHGLAFDEWQARTMATIEANDFTALSLHDCYADFWLPHYQRLLETVQSLGRLVTLDEVANETLFAHAA